MNEQFDLIVLGSGSGARDGANRLEATVDDLARAHHAFPTWAEGIKAAAEQAVE